jgi:DNA-binding transcriptional LysR family regulator
VLDHLRGLVVFAEVVESKSFARAAARLNMTRSAVSKHVAQLEGQLGVQLLSRTTRKLSLTEVGERVYAASSSVRDNAELAREAAHTHQGTVEGTLRVTAPVGLGRTYLVPLARDLMALHPRLEVALLLSDSYMDLVDERIDVALRVGRPSDKRAVDSTLVARSVAPVSIVLGAAPSYLKEHGTPLRPSDLERHQVIQHLPSPEPGRLVLSKGKRTVEVAVSGRLTCNDGATGVEAAILGLGVVSGPEFEVADPVRAGRLRLVLVGWTTLGMTLLAVTPPRRHVSSKVRTFVDFVCDRWKVPPWRIS